MELAAYKKNQSIKQKKKQNRIEMPTPVEVRTRKIRYSVCKS